MDLRGEYPTVYVIDEYEAERSSTPEQDARALLAMLARHGLTWRQLYRVTGDIPHYGGAARSPASRTRSWPMSWRESSALGVTRR